MIDYLKLDTFKLIQWMWKIVNNDNALQILSFRDWALTRNEQMIQLLSQYTWEKKYFDRMEQKERTVT